MAQWRKASGGIVEGRIVTWEKGELGDIAKEIGCFVRDYADR